MPTPTDTRSMHTRPWLRTLLLCAAAALVLGVAGSLTVHAQDAEGEMAAEGEKADDADESGDDVGRVGVIGEDGEGAAKDPADHVVVHITKMTAIVRDNIDSPDVVKKKLTAYIENNGEAMKEAGDSFEAHLNELPADERQAYKERLQRKMESALAEFLETMLDFSERHPEAARELDEALQKLE